MKRTYTLEVEQEDYVDRAWHAQLQDTHGATIATATPITISTPTPSQAYGLEGVLDELLYALIVHWDKHGELPPDGR